MKLIIGALSVGLHARDIIIKKTDNGFESLFKEIPKLPVFLKNGSNKENLIRSMLLHRINEDIGLVGYDVDYDQVFFLLLVKIRTTTVKMALVSSNKFIHSNVLSGYGIRLLV